MMIKKYFVWLELLLSVLVGVYLWVRPQDGSGAKNVLAVKVLSLSVWLIFVGLVALLQWLIDKFFLKENSRAVIDAIALFLLKNKKERYFP